MQIKKLFAPLALLLCAVTGWGQVLENMPAPGSLPKDQRSRYRTELREVGRRIAENQRAGFDIVLGELEQVPTLISEFTASAQTNWGEQKPTEPKFDVDTAIPLGSASDRTQGLYEVEYYLVQKGPWPNPALLERTVTMYWKQTPTRADVFSVVRIPQFIADRKYVFCQDCPVFVRTLRQPITEPPLEQEPETPAKDEKE